jgi:hypothetical protein
MSNQTKSNQTQAEICPICKNIPERVEISKEIAQFKAQLIALEGCGEYYRGSQLSTFNLLQCPHCKSYYEDSHHFYSDPESIMGLAREEDDWYVLTRLSQEIAQKRIRQVSSK